MTTKELEIGTPVCAKGRGADALAHWHGVVVRTTKTLIIVQAFRGGERRFNRDLESVPYQPYGGLRIDTICQNKEK